MVDKLYQSYYTNSSPITTYMVDKLEIKKNETIFEPCAGDGAFIDEILRRRKNNKITAFELNPEAYGLLIDKYDSNDITIHNEDTILFDENSLFNNSILSHFDKIIANPPYGAWQDYSKRGDLKKMFPNLYVKETYGLFLYKCINLLKENGKLSFIIPDTYLSLHNHKELRKVILTKTKIVEILKFPSSFFPGVNFGYAGLSIVTLQKVSTNEECLSNNFSIKMGYKKVDDLPQDAYTDKFTFSQKEVLENKSHAFYLMHDEYIKNVFNTSIETVGDLADCVTGIYTGNDKKYLRVTKKKEIKGGSKFTPLDSSSLNKNHSKYSLIGISSSKYFIPLQKSNGRTPIYSEPNWFVDWSVETVSHYNKDKKARFQNSSYYFRNGIGLPMVKTSQTLAFLLDSFIFDQSIVGIFPKKENDLFFLLGFLNSNSFKKLMNTINPSANNSSNYVKKTPIPKISSKRKIEIIKLTKTTYENLKTGLSDTGSYFTQLNYLFDNPEENSPAVLTSKHRSSKVELCKQAVG